MIIGYGKIGRSMPLSLDKCGTLGGDVECAAVVGDLARRHPNDTFVLLGRNSGEEPRDVGLPSNVVNPWAKWGPYFSNELTERGFRDGPLTVDKQFKLRMLFSEITLDAFMECDAHVWWVGQHGTSNSPIPMVGDRSLYTKPQDWCAYYASFIFYGLNAWRRVDPLNREEVYLNADPRNRHKMRDLQWPLLHPVLTQHNFSHRLKHERYGRKFWLYREFYDRIHNDDPNQGFLGFSDDGEVWISELHNVYSRLEVNALTPETPFGKLISYNNLWRDRGRFGLFINEAGRLGNERYLRKNALRDYILPLNPDWIHGTWSSTTKTELNVDISPAPWDKYFDKLHSVHSTFTTPSSCSGWATCKPWEAFAAGTVCFFHPLYDEQDCILGDAPRELREFLRIRSPRDLSEKVEAVHHDRFLWYDMVDAQREHFNNAMRELRYMQMIEERIYG